MMTAQQTERYEVKWCSDIPVDRATYNVRHFPNFDAAKAFAWQVLRDGKGKLPWEIVRIERQERQLDADIWEQEHVRVWEWPCREKWETTEAGEEPYRMD